MRKFLDIIIIFWLTILFINLFSLNKTENNEKWIIISSIDKSYTIPASVWLKINNNSGNSISLNTCSDISINKNGENIVLNSDFCKDITIDNNKEMIVDYWSQYEEFYDTGNYIFKINIEEKEFLSQFEIDNPWTIRKLFVSMFYAPIYNLLVLLIKSFSWVLWWAIVTITIIIRLILLYPQHKMMLSQKKLQAVQPKIKELQKKYKWQQQVLWVKLMELYKKEKVNPMWSCGLLFIQMPILLVLYNVILSVKDTSNYYYLYGNLVNFDFTNIDFSFFWINLLGSWWTSWIMLAIFVWWIQFIQVKLSLANKKTWESKNVVLEKKKWWNDYSQFMPEPEMMNKFMLYWMPVMVAIFTFNLLAWVWLYWWISTTFMVFQQLFVNKVLNKSNKK